MTVHRSSRTHCPKRGRTPGRPPLDPETVSAAQKLIEAGLSPGQAAKQIGNRPGNGLQNRKDGALKSESRCFGPLVILRTNLAMTPTTIHGKGNGTGSGRFPHYSVIPGNPSTEYSDQFPRCSHEGMRETTAGGKPETGGDGLPEPSGKRLLEGPGRTSA